MVKGFKNFLMRGDVVVLSIGLIVALAFNTLIKSFTTNVINPIINRAEGHQALGLGVQLGSKGSVATFLNVGGFVSSAIYFLIFMGVVYFVIVLPYKVFSARRGQTVFGEPTPTKTCPACLSADLPVAASKCLHCGTEQPAATSSA